MEEEIWSDIKGYEGKYWISNYGRIKSKNRLLKLTNGMDGYLKISLCLNGINRTFRIHRIVAITFIPNRKSNPSIDHINGDKHDNRVQNLRWCTAKENSNNPNTKYNNTGFLGHTHSDYVRCRISESQKGISNNNTKLNSEKVLEIRYLHKIGLSQRKIAKKYGVSHTNIGSIIRNKTWKYEKE